MSRFSGTLDKTSSSAYKTLSYAAKKTEDVTGIAAGATATAADATVRTIRASLSSGSGSAAHPASSSSSSSSSSSASRTRKSSRTPRTPQPESQYERRRGGSTRRHSGGVRTKSRSKWGKPIAESEGRHYQPSSSSSSSAAPSSSSYSRKKKTSTMRSKLAAAQAFDVAGGDAATSRRRRAKEYGKHSSLRKGREKTRGADEALLEAMLARRQFIRQDSEAVMIQKSPTLDAGATDTTTDDVMERVEKSQQQQSETQLSEEEEFELKVRRAPRERLTERTIRSRYPIQLTKSEVILNRVWLLLQRCDVAEALSILMKHEKNYNIKDKVPGAADDLPLWALMPSRLSKSDALEALPVWRFILKKFDVGNLSLNDRYGNKLTPISVAAGRDLDEYVRAVIAEEELQGTVKEQIQFAEKCEELQHNCILMIQTMKNVANSEDRRKAAKLKYFDQFATTLVETNPDMPSEKRTRTALKLAEKMVDEVCGPSLVESAFSVIRDALILLIKDRRCVLSELFNICWEWQKMHDEKSLWLTLKNKIKEVLTFPDLHEKPCDWHWYLENWANNPVMAELSVLEEFDEIKVSADSEDDDDLVVDDEDDGPDFGRTVLSAMKSISSATSESDPRTKYDDICDCCESELSKQAKLIEEDMRVMIESNERAWNEVGKFKFTNFKYSRPTDWRQDRIDFGVQASVKQEDLFKVSLFTSTLDFDAAQTYDLDSYLTDVLFNAHVNQPLFQNFMREVFHKDPICKVHAGPVKGIERCRVKAQLEYYHAKFPTSARIIDLIRCSLTFKTIDEFHKTLIEFSKIAKPERISDSQRRNAVINGLKKHGLKLEILRCKNGFDFEVLKYGKHFAKRTDSDLSLPIPCVYRDLKFNVVVTSLDRKVSVIGEVQFLLSAMLTAKLCAHEFYEVTRRQSFFHSVRKHLPLFPRTLKIAGSTQRQLTRLIVKQPLRLTNAVFTDSANDAENRNLMMKLLMGELKINLAEYLFALPQGVPNSIWFHVTEGRMTLLKYVLVLRQEKLAEFMIAQIPLKMRSDIWTLAQPLPFALELRDQMPEFVIKSLPNSEECPLLWNDSDVLYACIANKGASVQSRLELLIDNMSEEMYGQILRKPLQRSKLYLNALQMAILHHGVKPAVLDLLIPVFDDENDESEKQAMFDYWLYTADNGWDLLSLIAQRSNKANTAANLKYFEQVVPQQVWIKLVERAKERESLKSSKAARRALKLGAGLKRLTAAAAVASSSVDSKPPDVMSGMIGLRKAPAWKRDAPSKGPRRRGSVGESASMMGDGRKKPMIPSPLMSDMMSDMSKSGGDIAAVFDDALDVLNVANIQSYGVKEYIPTQKGWGKRTMAKKKKSRR